MRLPSTEIATESPACCLGVGRQCRIDLRPVHRRRQLRRISFHRTPHAKAVYGGNVPLTFADAFHVGNRAPRPGSNISDDLMNGVGFLRGHRYNISALDLAMLTDAGVPIVGSLPTLTVADATHAEGDAGTTSLVFDVSLTTPATNQVSVDYTIMPASTATDVALAQTQGTLTIPVGQTSGTILVPIIGNTAVQPDENVTLSLSNPVGATLAETTATGTITNDDLPVIRTITFTSRSAAKYADSSGKIVTVTLKGPGTGTITFNASSADADTISLSGTNAHSSLTVKARGTSVRKIVDNSPIGIIDARTVGLTSNFSAPVMTNLSLGNISTANLAFTGSTALMFTAGVITGSGITANGFKSFSSRRDFRINDRRRDRQRRAAFLASAIDSAAISVGTAIPPVGLPGTGTFFTKRSASLKTLTVRGTFSYTVITAPTIGTAKLGRIIVSNNQHSFGLAAHSITSVTGATPAKPHLKLTKLTKSAKNYDEVDFSVTVI